MATGTVFTNDVVITNLTAKNCSIDKLKDYFSNKKKSGISSFKDIKIVNQSTAILCLEDEEGMYILVSFYYLWYVAQLFCILISLCNRHHFPLYNNANNANYSIK